MACPLERGISAFAIWHLLPTADCGRQTATATAAVAEECRLQLKIRLHMNFSKCFLRWPRLRVRAAMKSLPYKLNCRCNGCPAVKAQRDTGRRGAWQLATEHGLVYIAYWNAITAALAGTVPCSLNMHKHTHSRAHTHTKHTHYKHTQHQRQQLCCPQAHVNNLNL